jgi:transposase
MSRYDLTDFEWRVIEPLLPNKTRGGPRVDDRRVLNGIFWVLRSGAPWRDENGGLGSRHVGLGRGLGCGLSIDVLRTGTGCHWF